jgi:hypothetical protein
MLAYNVPMLWSLQKKRGGGYEHMIIYQYAFTKKKGKGLSLPPTPCQFRLLCLTLQSLSFPVFLGESMKKKKYVEYFGRQSSSRQRQVIPLFTKFIYLVIWYDV